MMNIDECLEEGFLRRVKPAADIQKKEIDAASYDIACAKISLENKNHKWAIIQSYYAIFHASRSILNKVGYLERRHFVIGVVLESLSKDGKMSKKLVSDFKAAMSAREDADYGGVHSKETAEYIFKTAVEFIKETKIILKVI